jgi:hypothetical protein
MIGVFDVGELDDDSSESSESTGNNSSDYSKLIPEATNDERIGCLLKTMKQSDNYRSSGNFSEPLPVFDVWQKSKTVECSIVIKDVGGTGVDSSEIMYRYVESGDIEDGSWKRYAGASQNAESILCNQQITFDTDGIYKKIQWKAKTVSGTELIDMDYYSIKIDSTPVSMDGFSIAFDAWHKVDSPEISFYVNDTKPSNDHNSGVNVNGIKYQLSTSGLENYGTWLPLVPVGSGNSVRCTIRPEFFEGHENYIKFSALDLAENELISDDLPLKIDLSPPEFSNPAPDLDSWVNSTRVKCNITIYDELSFALVDSVRYSLSTNGTNQYDEWTKVKIKHLANAKYKTVTLSANVTVEEGENNYIRWFVSDSAGNNLTSTDYIIKVDITGCTFENPTPPNNGWISNDTVTCSIEVGDFYGAGVDTNSVEYSVSTLGLDRFGPWKNSGLNIEVLSTLQDGKSRAGESIPYLVLVSVELKVFNEGNKNYIRWRATDLANSNKSMGGPYRVQIDLSPLQFSSPKPIPKTVQSDREQTCKITITDSLGGSGLDPDTVQYRYSTSGTVEYNSWSDKHLSRTKKIEGYQFLIYINFVAGNTNYIQWRGYDLAGNGPFESEEYNVIINSPPLPKITSPVSDPLEDYDYSDNDLILFNARDTLDPDGVEELKYYWESNRTGGLGYSDYFKMQLPFGVHMITLFVSDGLYYNISIRVNITVIQYKFVKDTDLDNIADIFDPNIDNDDYPNEEDAFPEDILEWLDTDFDGIGNNKDIDDDGDDYPDLDDAYPLDSKRWKKEADSMGWISGPVGIGLIVSIIIVIVLVLFAFFRIKKRKKMIAAEESESSTGDKPISATRQKPQTQKPIPQPLPVQPSFVPPPPGPQPSQQMVQQPYQQQMVIPPMHPYHPPAMSSGVSDFPGLPPVQQLPPSPDTQSPQMMTIFKCKICKASILDPNKCPYCGWGQN